MDEGLQGAKGPLRRREGMCRSTKGCSRSGQSPELWAGVTEWQKFGLNCAADPLSHCGLWWVREVSMGNR